MSAVVKVQQTMESVMSTQHALRRYGAQHKYSTKRQLLSTETGSIPKLRRVISAHPRTHLEHTGRVICEKEAAGFFDVRDCPKSALSKQALGPCVLLQYRKYTIRVISVCMFNATLPLYSLKWDRSLCAVAQAELINTHIQYWSPHIHERLWKKAHHCSASFTRDGRC